MSRPTDIELMMYLDGELEPERREAVAKYLAESKDAAKKVRGLELGGAMLALRASRSPAADGVADAVMAAIAAPSTTNDRPSDIELMMYFDGELEAERREVVEAHLAASREASAKVRRLALGAELLARHVVEKGVAADRVADAVMAVIAEEAAQQDERPAQPDAKKPARPSTARPSTRPHAAANDNAKRIYAAAALAVAAAAALVIWGKTASDTVPFATPTPSAEVAPSAPLAVNTAPAVAPPASASADEDSEPEAVHGVEVAAVEFGGRMGSIFYVPSGDTGSSSTTTVVWLADDVGDE